MWQTKPVKPRSYRIVGPQQQVDERTTRTPESNVENSVTDF